MITPTASQPQARTAKPLPQDHRHRMEQLLRSGLPKETTTRVSRSQEAMRRPSRLIRSNGLTMGCLLAP